MVKKNLGIFLDIIFCISLFVLGLVSKAYILNNLGNIDLTGPDPYLFYRYAEYVHSGKIPDMDCYRYWPLCHTLDRYAIVIGHIATFFVNLLEKNEGLKDFLLSLLNYFKIKVNMSTFDLGIHVTPFFFFAISAVIYYFISREIFKSRILSFLISLIFIILPVIAFRVARFEKEPLCLPFILLSFLFYLLAIKKEKWYYYLLSGLSAIPAIYTWGGWKIIPLVIGLTEILRTILGKIRNFQYALSLVWMPFYNLSPFSLTNILPVSALILKIIYYIDERYKIYNYLLKVKISSKLLFNLEKRVNEVKNILIKLFGYDIYKRTLILCAILIIFLPLIIHKVGFILSNPWTERMASSIAEQQPSVPLEYLSMITPIFFALSIIGFSYILHKNLRNIIIALSLSIVFFCTIVLTNVHVFIDWLLLFLLIPYILYLRLDDEKLFVFSLTSLSFIIGDYINRLIFYTGLPIPLLVGFAIKYFDYIKVNTRKIIDENIKLILIALPGISGILLFKFTNEKLYLIPVFFLSGWLIYYYILNKDIELKEILKISSLLILLFGIPLVYSGTFNYFFLTKYYGGTEKYLIDALLWARNHTEKDALFVFWWDYGYYVQTIAKRVTFLDGGNAYPYWNHLMGRYGLCGNETEALELFYTHAKYDLITHKLLVFLKGEDNAIKFLVRNKLINLTEKDLKNIEKVKERLKEKYIEFLDKITKEDVRKVGKEYGLNEEEIKTYEKLKRTNYLRPVYLLIHPTDIGKFYQFSRLGSNEYFDKHSWISLFTLNGFSENSLIYEGYFELDQKIKDIPRCVPDFGIEPPNCGVIRKIELVFKDKIIELKGLKYEINISKINPDNLKEAYVYIDYRGKEIKLKLRCIYWGKKIEFKDYEYGGCFYIVPVYELISNNIPQGYFVAGFLISEKAMNYTWIKLYFFDEGKYFRKVWKNVPIMVIYGNVHTLQIWKVIFPENFTVPEWKRCLYLATNLKEINRCAERYGLKKYKSFWNV